MAIESVRAYLLGTLGDSEAAALEEKYFTNRDFFLRVRAIEAELIQQYLEGRLPPATRDLFESRYLRVPDLRERLEEVRSQLAANPTPTRPRLRALPFVVFASMTAILVGGAFWLQYRLRVEVLPPAPATQSVAAALRLSPGVLMGDSGTGRLVLPAEQAPVLVELELPGGGARSVTCSVRLAQVAADGHRIAIWMAPRPLVSHQFGRRQQLSVTLDRRLLQPGDYIIEVSGLDRPIQATYLFRALAAAR
jgi:hypothetical protein